MPVRREGEAVGSTEKHTAVQADRREIVTIEGLETDEGLDALQASFVEKGAVQCGFCTPGMILSAKNLLDRNPDPDDAAVRRAISGNLCRCTGYQKIVAAVKDAAEKRRRTHEAV